MTIPLKLNDSHRRILAQIRRDQPVTRAALARTVDLNSGPITQLTRDLLLAGLIAEGDRLRGARGQPALPLSLNPAGALSFGVGLAPGSVRTVALDFAGGVVDEAVAPLPENGPDKVAAIVERHIEAMTRKARLIDRSRILGVGMALPGFFFGDPAHMRVVDEHAPWRGHALKPFFERALGLKVWIENDATAAALAESYAPEARDSRCLALLLINYGIGGGLVIEGRPIRGAHGNAGEIGAYYPLGRARPSGTDLLGMLREGGIEAPSLGEIDTSAPGVAAVVERWAARAGRELLVAMEAAWAWLDPDLVIVAGGVPATVAEALAAAIPTELFDRHSDRPRPRIAASSMGPAIVAIGAAHLPLHAFIGQNPL